MSLSRLRELFRPSGWSFADDPSQLELLPSSPEEFRGRLKAAGLGDEWVVTLTENRATMVSFRGRQVRVHCSYVMAPDYVVDAVVQFVKARTRRERNAASRVILAYAPPRGPGEVVPIRRPEQPHPADDRWVQRLERSHAAFNAERFAGVLSQIEIRVSRRMRRRLGHYVVAEGAYPTAIAISRWHIRHDPWAEVLHTLLHEMVHQWQSERSLPVAHDRAFRRKAREVGIDPRATRVDDVATAAVGS